jgi:hypothetical protein
MCKKVLGIFLFIFIAFIASCTVQKHGNEYIWIYKRDMIGDVGNGPTYLILRSGGLYELYSPGGSAQSDWGTFEISNDTLRLGPIEYLSLANHKIKQELDTLEVSFSSIPTYFIIKKDQLIDITEYQKYPELAPWAPSKGGVNDGYIRIGHF